MTIIGDQRDELDPVQELLSMVESMKSMGKPVPQLSTEEYAKQHKEKILAKHRQRIRDGFVGEDERNLPKRSKLSPVEKVDQLIRYKREIFPLAFMKMVEAQEEAVKKLYEPGVLKSYPLVFEKMVQAQQEAVDKLYDNGVLENYPLIFDKMAEAQEEAVNKLYGRLMPDAPYENFCGSYGALQILP